MKIEIHPLEKVVIDGVSIHLGMEQAVVEAALGKGQRVRERHYYYDSEMAIDYRDGQVEFIEFLGGIDGLLRPSIYGVSAFETLADDLAALLQQKNGGKVEDSERGYSMTFHRISVGVYRETTPSDVMEMIEEMKADGIPIDDNEDVKGEQRKAAHWASIGVGAAGYYRR